MALEPAGLLAALAAIIGLGFLGHLVFERYRIPDVIALILLGIVLGPLLNIFPPAAFAEVAPTIGALALLVILFDAGLSVRFSQLRHALAPAGFLAALGFTLTAIGTGLALSVFAGWPFSSGLLLGAVVGGSSSIAVIPALAKLGAPDRVRVVLSIESALTDVLCVVGTIVLATAIGSGSLSVPSVAGTVGFRFAVAAIAGAGAGVGWMLLWPRLEGRAFAYMMTLATLIAVDVAAEAAGGSGPIAVLVFGLMIGNEFQVLRRFTTAAWQLEGEMRRFHGEIVFFFRAFFFVGLGVLIGPSAFGDLAVWGVGAIVVVAIVVARAAAALLLGLGAPSLTPSRWLVLIMMPRGLAAAVLATSPDVAAAPGASAFLPLAFFAILATNAIAMGAPFVPRPRLSRSAQPGATAGVADHPQGLPPPAQEAVLPARADRLEGKRAERDQEIDASPDPAGGWR